MTANLQELKDHELENQLKSLVSKERELTTLILRHLEEIERRRLYLPKYSSLFEYCTLELGYTAASAQRRISSMRVVKNIPQVEEKITSGALSLSNVAQAAKFFREEEKNNKPLSRGEQLAVLTQLENKSTRQAEQELAVKSSNPHALFQQESIRPITETHSKMTFIADQNLLENLERIKALLSHRYPQMTTCELIAEMAKVTLAKLESEKFAKSEKSNFSQSSNKIQQSTSGVGSKLKRYISAHIKRAVYERDGIQCTFVDPASGRRCTSRHQLEFDHLTPFSLGGQNDLKNLTLRCRSHNLWRAVQVFEDKTEKYLKK